MKRICVFCGSSFGVRPEYADSARALGRALVARNIALVFGGGHVGLMGVLADAVLGAGGQAIGVIPRALADKELAHRSLTQLHVVGSMHQRKAMMADLSDGFLALPGGLGTLEEFLEIVTWAQLGLHSKPCGVLNVRGFFNPLLAFLDRVVEEQFLDPEYRSMILIDEEPDGLLRQFEQYNPPALDKAQQALRQMGRKIR
jgi:hypothetical protein